MPSNPQRLPAERVRHRKRLPFQGWPDAAPLPARQFTLTGPITITTTIPRTTANADTTNTPVVLPPPVSSPAATPSLPPPPSSPPPPPNTNPPTSPAPPVVSLSSGTAGTTPTPIASAINPGSSRTATEGAQVNGGQAVSQQHGLPTGAVVGITIACVMLILGAFIFFIRQRALRNRKLRRQTAPWMGAPRPTNNYGSGPSVGNMGEASPGVSFARAQQAALAARPPVPPTMPASSYNNPIPVPVPAGSLANAATVRYEFIPSLPDELSITTGEVVRVLSEYDDGWALCKNGRGDQGMVPLECLDQASAPAQTLQAETQDYRNSRRTSSLRVGY
ncbi:SH3 domain-containing protein [Mycena venus]|uniref:SH3 domain-containing protein n=1 Tax=Mycena venus TaxID=2733690 RepID=A0A8H7CIV2_9AGAR|nr:SH3 domain-containing protein [Mycena venus]